MRARATGPSTLSRPGTMPGMRATGVAEVNCGGGVIACRATDWPAEKLFCGTTVRARGMRPLAYRFCKRGIARYVGDVGGIEAAVVADS